MTAQELIAMRKKMQMTQTQIAKAMGLSLRGYQKLEDGESNIREVYRLALERLSLTSAAEHRDVTNAVVSVRREAAIVADIIKLNPDLLEYPADDSEGFQREVLDGMRSSR
ncbi:XRE family transcriptional regulator [Rhizobium ruizarguesonis]|jgi:transcriptional regulator with XRE-family HTH domain|uniref:helix-turn-helix domain-containing protein n=1 Tax=Rhizobium ruizarguesonis TaxID=2081791 RepID=UPI001030A7DB|nr:helix-turn-helix transcriptional regulator [Rhizobium ruizarguesonis]TBB44202.1 XRE family transcriptional regulator [Rhizobium ruizarguesonis]